MQKWKENEYPKADKERMETQCFKSAWVAVAIHEGFHFQDQYSGLTSAPNTVNGRVAHWTVGALLYRTRYFPLRYLQQNYNITFNFTKNTNLRFRYSVHYSK